eukprot:jgi/Psemu1/39816/gm1.39816_g
MLTYSECFLQATASPFGSSPAERNEAYNTILGYFSPASTPQSLLEQLLNLFEDQAVGALGIFVADALGKPRLRLVHDLQKYPIPLVQHSPDTDKAFDYLDDIEGEAGELVVLVDSDMLSQTTASRVLSLEHHMAELYAHQQRPSIPVVQEGTGHSELIRAHKAFFIPFDMVPFLIGKGLSPRQAMGILYLQLNHAGLVVTCAPLFDTLRVAGTAPTVLAVYPMLLQPGTRGKVPSPDLMDKKDAICGISKEPNALFMTGLDVSFDANGNTIESYPEGHQVYTEMGKNSKNLEKEDGFVYLEGLFQFRKPMDQAEDKYKAEVFECPVDANGNKETILQIAFLEKNEDAKRPFASPLAIWQSSIRFSKSQQQVQQQLQAQKALQAQLQARILQQQQLQAELRQRQQ